MQCIGSLNFFFGNKSDQLIELDLFRIILRVIIIIINTFMSFIMVRVWCMVMTLEFWRLVKYDLRVVIYFS